MSDACDVCVRANANPACATFNRDCLECEARLLSSTPMFYRQVGKATFVEVDADYKGALRTLFGDRWREGHERVKHWYERRRQAAIRSEMFHEGGA